MSDEITTHAQFPFGIELLAEIVEHQRPFTTREDAAVNSYTGLGYDRINSWLRHDVQELSEQDRADLEVLTELVGSATVESGFRVTRTSWLHQVALPPHGTGDIVEAGFLSTSLLPVPPEYLWDDDGNVESRVLLDILVLPGAHAVYVGNSSQVPEEEELLVIRGAQLLYLGHERVTEATHAWTVRFILRDQEGAL